MRWLDRVIGRPEQAHRVKTPEEYRQKAQAFLLRHGASPVLRERTEQSPAYVSDGRWVCDCDCGNSPSVSPEWGMAVCFECGSVWQPTMPADYREAERILLARSSVFNRHYFPTDHLARRRGLVRAETVADLRRENRAHGFLEE